MKIVRNINIDIYKWQNLCDTSHFSSPFQTKSFFDLYNSILNLSAEVFAVEENNVYTSLVVITIQKEKGIKAFFSMRGIIYGGPLVANKSKKSLIFLLDIITNYYKSKLIYVEIRNSYDYSEYDSLYKALKWKFIPYLNFKLHLENKKLKDLLSGMNYNRRREIKISLENNAIYKECETEEEITSLYFILKDLYLKKVKLPIPDLIFFIELWKSNVGKVFIVKHEERVIGGSFCVVLNKNSIYTFYYCGLRGYNKKIFPTHLAIIAALNYAINNKCRFLDFMGAGQKGENYGVREYKKEFGGELNEFGRYRKILNPILFIVGVKGINILKNMSRPRKVDSTQL